MKTSPPTGQQFGRSGFTFWLRDPLNSTPDVTKTWVRFNSKGLTVVRALRNSFTEKAVRTAEAPVQQRTGLIP
jgi:hypothetical protein